jgi:polysaccharide deacetylase 2 family uncharacterized protein YibQ
VLRSGRQHSRTRKFPLNKKVVVAMALLLVCMEGCRKSKQMPEEEIHRITREFVYSANSILPRDAEVKGEVGAFDKVANSSDRIEIHLSARRTAKAYPPVVTELFQKFNGIATARKLTRDPDEERSGGNLIIVTYRYRGMLTHTIHVHLAGVSEARVPEESKFPGTQKMAELAIILDDLGNDRGAAETIFAMPYHLTVSVLPNQTHSAEIAAQAHRRGFEVMLHLPMQSVSGQHQEAQELRGGMSKSEVSLMVGNFLDEVPGAQGVNNHQGSQSTADPKLMAELMPVLEAHKLFYVDSRTSAETVAYDTAQHFGVRTAYRNVPFLDDVEQVPAIKKQIELALDGAQKKKEAIAIGHAYPATLQALKEVLPEAENHGVKLVFASELVR